MLSLQEQYIFVYDAVRELLLLGDTTIKASDVRRVLSQLKNKSGGKNGYQKQFAVSDRYVCTFVMHVIFMVNRTVLNEACAHSHCDATIVVLLCK